MLLVCHWGKTAIQSLRCLLLLLFDSGSAAGYFIYTHFAPSPLMMAVKPILYIHIGIPFHYLV